MIEKWWSISLVLCGFGFLKEIRPSEPFIYEFLIGKWRNVTEEQVNQQVYPAGIYSYLGLLVVVFLVTDLARYKSLMVVMGLSGAIVFGMLLWTKELWELLVLEVFYGSFMACEVAYYTYIYAKVEKRYYQQVTSHTRAAILAGRALSGIVGQALVSSGLMDYRQLAYITFGALVAATLWCLALPPVQRSIYFHQDRSKDLSLGGKSRQAFNTMRDHLKHAYSNKYTVRWSVWWSLSTCGFVQVQTYMQPLWNVIVDDPERSIYNGAVEASLTILGFIAALTAGFLKIDWARRGEIALTCCSCVQGALMIVSSYTGNVMICYACYVLFGALFHFVVTVASSEIAKFIDEDSYGLIFGINTFVATLFQTVLTLVAVVGLALPPRKQYLVYGLLHVALGVVYCIIGLVTCFRKSDDSNAV